MEDSRTGKIYKITSANSDKCYYGSCIIPINHRLCNHESNLRRYKQGRRTNVTSFEILEAGDYKIELVEEIPAAEKDSIKERERWWIENNECVNKQIPGRSRAEYTRQYRNRPDRIERTREISKKSREKNKEKNRPKKLVRDREYYQKNKDKMSARWKEKITCECGSSVARGGISEHKKSEKHLYFLKHGELPPKPEGNPFVICECGASVKKYGLGRHRKGKKHSALIKQQQ